jgi:hypothetical protein
MSSEPVYSIKGVQDTLEVYDNKVTITPKGVMGFLNKGMKGTKTIPFSSITAVQYKKAGGFTNGYLQFSLLGGIESRGGLLAATQDENTFMFASKLNKKVEEIKKYIENKVESLKETASQKQSPLSISDELEKLAALKEKGIITEEEFQSAKKQLIG